MVGLALILTYYALCIRLAWIDMRTGLLPDRLTCPLLWLGLTFNLFISDSMAADAVAGALLGYGFFWTIYWIFIKLRGYEGLGFGDVKLLAALGAWHGWLSIFDIVFYAAVSGCTLMLSGRLFCTKRVTLKTPLPFGPFLVAAGFIISWKTLCLPVGQALKPLL